MLHSLKESVSEKFSSVLEKLAPSFQQERRAEVASKRDLKRSKDRYNTPYGIHYKRGCLTF